MIKLNGHSGCSVLMLSNNIVRKTSANLDYNSRLEKQMIKQKQFYHSVIKTSDILDCGYDENGLFYFDMKYIRGVNLSIYFQQNVLNSCLKIIDLFSTFNNKNKIDISDQINQKINTMNVDDESRELIMNQNWIVSGGYCHGDLTFENIIINNDGIYLIDFLDSFVECPIIDESKLLQDSFCYWSFKNIIPERKLLAVSDKFNTRQHYCMLLLHLLRIIPYVNGIKKDTLLCMINRVKLKINQF
jgi:serine/threonine protein kinase